MKSSSSSIDGLKLIKMMDKSSEESVIEKNTIFKRESCKIDLNKLPLSEDCEKY